MRTRLVWFGAGALLLIAAGLLFWQLNMHDQDSDAEGVPSGTTPAGLMSTGSTDTTAFVNTCDAKTIGFLGADGRQPTMRIAGAPEGSILLCRSGPVDKVTGMSFTPCDGKQGLQRRHVPPLRAEGRHRTEVRYVLGDRMGDLPALTYYVHRSLDRAPCCPSILPDDQWYAAAKAALPAAPAFDGDIQLDKPFIRVSANARGGKVQEELLSLRRSFRLSEDRSMLLITRTTASRRSAEKGNPRDCVGLRVHVPVTGPDHRAATCQARREESPYRAVRAGGVDSDCPNVFCTVTSCRQRNDGCLIVTHTFNRGPGQKPWRVEMPPHCPPRGGLAVLSHTTHACDAYALNSQGQAVCMTNQAGRVQSVALFGPNDALGLKVLDDQRTRAGDRYVFSYKLRRRDVQGVLYLPP